MVTVLVADDDETVREVVAAYLHRAGLPTVQAGDGLAAVAAVRDAEPDLVVLDIMLPGIDGLEALRRMRAERPGLPVLLLTARSTEQERVAGLEVGADDYVVKPFSARELVLRVQALLRRVQAGHSGGSLTPGSAVLRDADLVVDRAARTVLRGEEILPLTGREFDLLVYLMSHPGVALSRETLMQQVWGWDFGDNSTVTVHIRRLRSKVELDPAMPRRITTVWGSGYRWDRRAS
ncbi:MAG TPA: response regulator transcription factor [Ornithinimicrobium sp.]|uniref:response regulator transcription factor n=1 Tax=Ornithinimicrobium sp. TaxID=1977084 RepID=UPI002B46EA64|nr:response regulator transcription factor [Ornithinimicrobium sp.]HKJ11423.1 response regulator transcription factor [Ornithinimicrobium sp.]